MPRHFQTIENFLSKTFVIQGNKLFLLDLLDKQTAISTNQKGKIINWHSQHLIQSINYKQFLVAQNLLSFEKLQNYVLSKQTISSCKYIPPFISLKMFQTYKQQLKVFSVIANPKTSNKEPLKIKITTVDVSQIESDPYKILNILLERVLSWKKGVEYNKLTHQFSILLQQHQQKNLTSQTYFGQHSQY
eukprot:TRINITY_DN1308_c0_g1_i8.p2 TRINITY_DN1308_c0_g1~~TRINITY_DN1308_c0_g1_i8.p2  ORF type:complete len:189 (+),score=2.05 TRINITY_DN1308_c0_g1_i8:775-1341(+)